MKVKRAHLTLVGALALFLSAQGALAHVTISPRESAAGATETYNIRVPTERGSPTVRIEVTFPAELSVSDVGTKPGWEEETIVDADGRIERVVWSGGSIAQGESEDFSLEALNPSDETTLVWKAVQIHADGSKAEWIGEPGSRNPAPTVEIQMD